MLKERLLIAGCLSILPLVGCTHRTQVASTARIPPATASACVLSADAASFPNQLWISAAPNDPASGTSHVVLGLVQAAHVQVSVPIAANDAQIAFETSMVRVNGFVPVSEVPVYPSQASTFGGVVIPLAHHSLSIDGTRPTSLRLLPHAYAPVRLRVRSEWRDCTYARLQPVAAFEVGASASEVQPRPLHLDAGYRELLSSPESPTAEVGIEFAQGESVEVLDERGADWARIRWATAETAFVGWINRNRNIGPTFGHGAWVGNPTINPEPCERARVVNAEVPLWAHDGNLVHTIGVLKAGARVEVLESTADFTRIHICDPDLRSVPSARILVSPTSLAPATH